MTEGGYTRDEILKGERIILQVRLSLPLPQARTNVARRASTSTSRPTAPLTRGSAVSAKRTTTTSKLAPSPSSLWRSPSSIIASCGPSRA